MKVTNEFIFIFWCLISICSVGTPLIRYGSVILLIRLFESFSWWFISPETWLTNKRDLDVQIRICYR